MSRSPTVAPTTETLRQVRQLRADVGGHADDAVRDLTAAWVAGWDALDDKWALAVAAVLVLAVELGRWPQPWELARLSALRVALDGTETALADLSLRTDKTVTEAAGAAIAATLLAEAGILASQLPAAGRADALATFTANVSAATARLLAAASAVRIGDTVRPLARTAFAEVQRTITRTRPVDTDSRRLARHVEAVFNGALTRAMNTARTETLDAYRAAAQAVQQANRGHLAGWQWLCSLDRRACVACWVMHGTVHDVDDPGPLDHPNGRCMRLGVVRDDTDATSAVPDARFRFDALPEADQVAILGPHRLDLLRAGRITWADLAQRRTTRGWRPSYAPTSVTDLQRIARIRA